MNALSDGMNIDPAMHAQVLTNKLVQATIREAQMEAAIQTLIAEKNDLQALVQRLDKEMAVREEEDASAK